MYDSDAASNHHVIAAENEFARQLIKREAIVHIVRFPQLELGSKIGLDDYLVHEGKESFMKLVQEEAPEWETSRELRAMNEDVAFIRRSAEVMTLADGGLYPTKKFFDLYADRNFTVKTTITMPNGGVTEKLVEKNVAKEWFKSPIRAKVQRMVYEPGKEKLIYTQGEEFPDYNVWPRWGVEPKKGDVRPFLDLVDFLLDECTKDERAWFLRWLAYPIQHPGTKLFSTVLVHGRNQGTGKSLLGEIMGLIYGENYKLVNDSELLATFNEWARHRQFIMGDEIGAKVRKAADLIKGYITQSSVSINMKFISQYSVRDCMNYYFTSNHPNATYLEEDDRRHFVAEVHGKPLEDSFYKTVRAFKFGDGPARVMDYLMSLDLADFNPSARPPLTSAKERMIVGGRSDAADWAIKLRDNQAEILNPLKMPDQKDKRVATPAQLLKRFRNGDDKSLGPIGLMNTVLSEAAGFVQACEGKQIFISKSWGAQRIWLLDSSLRNATEDQIRKVFLEDHGADSVMRIKGQ